MSKRIDKKFEKIGFTKVKENDSIVSYERYIPQFKYTQVLELMYKESGRHIVFSYEKGSSSVGNGFCAVVGISMREMKLCIKKMKSKGWKSDNFIEWGK